jgi:hypothetical protein
VTDETLSGLPERGGPPPWSPPPWAPTPPSPSASPWTASSGGAPWTGSPEAGLTEPSPYPTPSPRRRPVGIIAVTIAVVAVLISGVAAVVALTAPDTNTPGSAVTGLLTAAGNGDALGLLDHIDPAERDALTGFVTNGTGDLERLGLLPNTTDLHHIGGLSASFDNVQTTTTDLRPGLTAVRITGGTVHSRLDPSQLPLGPFIRQHAGSALAKVGVKDVTVPLHLTATIVTIRRGGTWYVSLGYTAAEAARVAAKQAMPNPQDAVPAVGAASPKAAVDDFVHALAGLDVRRLVELTPPDEMAALHDYAPLFLPSVTAAIGRAPHVSITITALDLTSTPHAGGELVTIGRIGLHASIGQVTIDLAPGSRCPTVTGASSLNLSGLCGTNGAGASVPPGISGALKSLSNIRAEAGIVTVERNGAWFVSPTRTVLDDLESVLHALPSNFLDQLKNAFNPAAILGNARIKALSGAASASISSQSTGASPAVGSQCVNGTATITFPTVVGQPAPPAMTIPCPPDATPTAPGG